jgi:hypothetical protein
MSDKYAIYEKHTLRELELELTIFKRDRKSCFEPRRIHWIEEHISFLEQMIAGKRQ